MAYDEVLAARVAALLEGRDAVTERRMFGGIAWMVHGNMACGVLGEELMVRLPPEDAERALAQPHVRPFEMRPGRPSRGAVVVGSAALGEDGELASWVDAGAAHAASLPPK